MKVEKTKEGKKYKYGLLNKNKEIAYIKGLLLNEPIILSLYEFYVEDKQLEQMSAEKIGANFFEDCQKNDTTIIVRHTKKTQKAIWFLNQNQFTLTFTRYVFENNLAQLEKPLHTFKLKPLQTVKLKVYQQIFFECSKGDPEIDLSGLTYESHYEKEKKETGDLWDEGLVHLVYFESKPIGVLNLRTEKHQTKPITEGTINYIALLPTYRKRGLGSTLHLTGLHQLKALGCQNYFGGTSTNNKAMLKTFEKNKCHKTLTEHYYKALN